MINNWKFGVPLLQHNLKLLFSIKLIVGFNPFMLLQFAIETFCKFSLKNFIFQVDIAKLEF